MKYLLAPALFAAFALLAVIVVAIQTGYQIWKQNKFIKSGKHPYIKADPFAHYTGDFDETD
ncbi:MAG: hypothetical protein J7K90_09755 [Desulfuromusa sp.]|nr:hypothetical protein [Desulfuromusa sp.]